MGGGGLAGGVDGGVGSELLGELESFTTERAEPGLCVHVLHLVLLVFGLVVCHEPAALHGASQQTEVQLVFPP